MLALPDDCTIDDDQEFECVIATTVPVANTVPVNVQWHAIDGITHVYPVSAQGTSPIAAWKHKATNLQDFNAVPNRTAA